METKTRVGAIIIQNDKILMLKGVHKELWTPGGKIDNNESEEECLQRELDEEIGVKLKSMKFFGEYMRKSHYHDYMMKNRMYLVEIEGTPKPDKEIKEVIWLSKGDFENKKYLIIPVIEEEVFSDLKAKKLF
ncbi:NUDIX hydrolase [Candidatus Woesearchaeota archaeon]|nr:NUDIX hydrolase [Candidatus Woesearchaeota archaeon]MBW3005502.1 NUDIX hydrolase [Candidatus Woesearchaeota archaeon]